MLDSRLHYCVFCSNGYLGVQIPALMVHIISILLIKEEKCEFFFFFKSKNLSKTRRRVGLIELLWYLIGRTKLEAVLIREDLTSKTITAFQIRFEATIKKRILKYLPWLNKKC